jgi:hypothetical protein
MPPATRHAPIVLLAALLLAGCNPATGSADNAPSGKTTPTSATADGSGRTIATGPGPQTHYTVQQQPPAGSCHYRYDNKQPLEDPACTPGAISPAVTQANLTTTICRKGGYTSGIRPSASSTGKEKKLNATSYGYSGPMRDAEYDHELSGAVTSIACM